MDFTGHLSTGTYNRGKRIMNLGLFGWSVVCTKIQVRGKVTELSYSPIVNPIVSFFHVLGERSTEYS